MGRHPQYPVLAHVLPTHLILILKHSCNLYTLTLSRWMFMLVIYNIQHFLSYASAHV